MNWQTIATAIVGLFVLFLVYWLIHKYDLSDDEPFKGHKVISVNGETALVDVYGDGVVAQNPFPELVVGDCVHVREQGTGFASYTVITHVY